MERNACLSCGSDLMAAGRKHLKKWEGSLKSLVNVSAKSRRRHSGNSNIPAEAENLKITCFDERLYICHRYFWFDGRIDCSFAIRPSIRISSDGIPCRERTRNGRSCSRHSPGTENASND